MDRLQYDGKKLEELTQKYSGAGGGHFAMIVNGEGRRQICVGGRCDLVGMGISEGIARLVRITPGLGAEFIDAVAETARMLLSDLEEIEKEGTVQ